MVTLGRRAQEKVPVQVARTAPTGSIAGSFQNSCIAFGCLARIQPHSVLCSDHRCLGLFFFLQHNIHKLELGISGAESPLHELERQW